jgi:hypothetical protein
LLLLPDHVVAWISVLPSPGRRYGLAGIRGAHNQQHRGRQASGTAEAAEAVLA